MIDKAQIPADMLQERQWIARIDKLPINPHTLYGARSTEPTTWGTFEEVMAVQGRMAQCGDTKGKVNGIGFVLTNGYCGIDIDHAINTDTGEIDPKAVDIIDTMKSYTEFSPSGAGVHIIYKGNTHKSWSNKKKIDETILLEMYQQGRYFTFTGNTYNGIHVVTNAEQQAQTVYNRYFGEPKQRKEQRKEQRNTSQSSYSTVLDDLDLIQKIQKSKQGAKFDRLYSGDISEYGNDESRADQALCNILAFWCKNELKQIDRIFRTSGLMRDKWDRKTGNSTYGLMTIHNAINSNSAEYDPQFRGTQQEKGTKNVKIRPIEKPEDRVKLRVRFEFPEITYDVVRHYSADDIGTAELFSELVRDYVCYVQEHAIFYLYDGTVWIADSKEAINTGTAFMDFVKIVSKLIPPPPPGKPKEWSDEETAEENFNQAFRKHYKNLSFANGRERALKDVKKILNQKIEIFDTDPYLFNVKNGTLNLKTGELQKHKATDFLTKIANVNYDPNAYSERFYRFICEITQNNKGIAEALQRALGYALFGKAPEECFFVALGTTTRNGKGTLFDTVLHIFGDYGTQIAFETLARTGVKDGSRATPDIARLKGVRLVLCNEPDKGSCFNEALIKQLTGNDEVYCRRLYSEPFVYKPGFKLFITANSMPTISDESIFESGRLKMLPFNRHFAEEEQDKTLKDKFREEDIKSAILNWLIDGYGRYKTDGLKNTQEMKDLVIKYKDENDYIKMYIDERLILDNNKKTSLKVISLDYQTWCSQMGIQKPLGYQMFKRALEKHNIQLAYNHKQWLIKGEKRTEYPEFDIEED